MAARPARRQMPPPAAAGVVGAIGGAPDVLDRPMFMDEVHARLPKGPDGAPRFSKKWVRVNVAPDAKRYAGRLVYWLTRDVLAWERDYFTSGERRRVA